jgi:hypothetical protein
MRRQGDDLPLGAGEAKEFGDVVGDFDECLAAELPSLIEDVERVEWVQNDFCNMG